MINIQSTLHTAPDLCTNSAFAVLLGNSDNSHTVSTYSDVCTYTCSSQYREADQAKIKKIKKKGAAVKAACHFGHGCHRLGSPVLGYDI
jgi:hypothetical protein